MNSKEGIPKFLKKDVSFCNRLILSRNKKTSLILLNNLQFFEFENKRLINFIDLNNSLLRNVKDKVKNYQGSSGTAIEDVLDSLPSTATKNQALNAEINESYLQQQPNVEEITFGKFIYQNLAFKRLYIIIKCWDVLLILLRDVTEGLKLEAEYENVTTYKLGHGKCKFQAELVIYCNEKANKDVIRRDFHEDVNTNKDILVCEGNNTSLPKSDILKKVLKKIKIAKTELLVHRSITCKEYQKLKTLSTFGCNFVRSPNLEEKFILSKCGDVWYRLTSEDLVIGIPIVNNSSSPRLTTVRNLCPFIGWNEVSSVRYDFKLYQLKQEFSNLESVETFFQCQDQQEMWVKNEEYILLPESFSVLLIKVPMTLIILHCNQNKKYPLILFYELVLPKDAKNNISFHQQLFLQNMDFNKLLENRREYEINFNQNTLNQDLLSVAATSEELQLSLEFTTEKYLEDFDEMFKKLDFTRISREYVKEVNCSTNTFGSQYLFFNKKFNSIWYGTLAVRVKEWKKAENVMTHWSFYTRTTDKSILLMRMLTNCNVNCVKLIDKENDSKLVEIEGTMRKELNEILRICKSRRQKKDAIPINTEELLRLEMQTDIATALS